MLPDQRAPTVGETWKRRGGKERVRVDRVWPICACDSEVMHGYRPEHDAGQVDAIRVQPRHGGKWWWALMPDFLERFDPEEPRASDEEEAR